MKKISIAFFPAIMFRGSVKNQKPSPQKKFLNNVRKIPTPERTTLPKQPKIKELVA